MTGLCKLIFMKFQEAVLVHNHETKENYIWKNPPDALM
jgi:RecB family endonuclease NucS